MLMTTRLNHPLAILLQAIFVAPLGCLPPTQAFVEITTDASCADLVSTGISAGLHEDIETGRYDTTTSLCSDSGEIGSIVLVPPEAAEKDAPFAFKVVGSLGANVEDCVGPDYGPGCIVARRAMRFVPQQPFHVPVHLGRACAGVVCPDTQTCVDGVCRSATVDPYDCQAKQACTPEGGDAPEWTKPIAGNGLQMVRHIATDAEGTLAVTGAFDNTIDLGGKPLVSQGATDVFLASFSQGGLHKWSLAFGGPQVDDTSRVAIGPDGAVLVLIGFQDKIEIGGNVLSSAGNHDLALAKFTHFGKFEWSIRFGGPSTEHPSGLVVDHEGNIYASGSFSDTMNVGGQTITSNGETDAFLMSFTPTGNLRWTKAIGGMVADGGSSVGVDASGQVYVAGFVAGDVEFGPEATLMPLGQSDAFVASYDGTGQFRWVQSVGTQTNDRLADLAVRDDRVVVTGTIGGAGRIADQPLEPVGGLGLAAAFDTSGALVWAHRFGETKDGRGESVVIASDGSIVLGGEINGGTVLGSKPATLLGTGHPFVATLERDGTPRWAHVFSSSTYATTAAVAAAPNGFAYVAGWFAGDLESVPKPLSSIGAEDGFLLRVTAPLPAKMTGP